MPPRLDVGGDALAGFAQFGQGGLDELLAAEARVDAMSRIKSSLSITWAAQSSGVAGLNTSPALQPCSRISESVRSTWRDASGWKVMMAAPALANSGTSAIDRLDHQVHVDRQPGRARRTASHTIGPMVRLGT